MAVSEPAPVGRQAYLEGIGDLSLRAARVSLPGPGQVLVQVEVSLICGTDLKTYRRGHSRLPVPGPIGHEGTGTIVAVGRDVASFRPGQAVVWLPTAPCGHCSYCRWGLTNHCMTLLEDVVLGVHGDYVLLPARVVRQHLFPRPRGMAPATAALLEPLACVLRGWARVAGLPNLTRAGQPLRTLVVGGGPIGLMHVAVAAARGPVVCVGARGKRGDLARALGATVALPGYLPVAASVPGDASTVGTASVPGDASTTGTASEPGDASTVGMASVPGDASTVGAASVPGDASTVGAASVPGDASTVAEILAAAGFPLGSFDLAIDCTGAKAVWEQLPATLRPGGVALLFGGLAGGTTATFAATPIHYDEITLLGSFHYTAADVLAALAMLQERHHDLSAIITHRAPLSAVAAVFAHLAHDFTGGKVALLPDPAAAATMLGYEREALL